jgi:type VI secretion system protein ImpJ
MSTEIHWSEGMFLGPHHLQVFQRSVLERVWAVADQTLPYAWGARRVKIAAADIENYLFGLQAADLVFQDGTRLLLPGNSSVEPRSFKDALDAEGGTLDVYVGVPQYRPAEANIANTAGEGDRRYVLDEYEQIDENTGRNPQPLLLRRLNARLFFSGEDVPRGFQTLRVASLRRSAGAGSPPVLNLEQYPPVVQVDAWPPLLKLCNELVAQVEAKKRYLGERLAGRPVNFGTGGSADFEALLKLHAVNHHAPYLKQLCQSPHLHPYSIFTEMVRLAGGLSIFDSERRVAADNIPLYDHDKLGFCFNELYLQIVRLLEKMVPMSFVIRPFAPVPGIRTRQALKLEPELIAAAQEFYLMIRTPDELSALRPKVDRLKIGSARDIDVLKAGRFPGLFLHNVERIPPELPVPEQGHYFRMQRDGPSDRYWKSVEANKDIVLDSPDEIVWECRLYVVVKEAMRGRVQ